MLAKDFARDAKPVEWIVDGLIARGSTIVLAGAPKASRKTLAATALGLAVAQGKPFLGRKTTAMPVIYSYLEDGEERVKRRLVQFGVLDTPGVIYMRPVFWRQGLDEGLAAVASAPHLWVVDSLIKLAVYNGIADENNSVQMTDLIERYRPAVQATGSALLITHHYAKYLPVMRGSSAIQATVDGWANVTVQGGGRRLDWTLRDADPAEMGMDVRLVGGYPQERDLENRWSITACDVPEETTGDRFESAIKATVFSRGMDDVYSIEDFATACGVHRRNKTLHDAVQRMIAQLDLAVSGSTRDRAFRAGRGLREAATAASGSVGF